MNKTYKCGASEAPTIPSLVTSIVSFCWSAAHVALFSLYLYVCMCMRVYRRVTRVGGRGVCKQVCVVCVQKDKPQRGELQPLGSCP